MYEILAQKTARLKNAAPQLFDEFQQAFADETNRTLLAVAVADAADILRFQGHSQRMLSLNQMFVDCEKVVASQEKRAEGRAAKS